MASVRRVAAAGLGAVVLIAGCVGTEASKQKVPPEGPRDAAPARPTTTERRTPDAPVPTPPRVQAEPTPPPSPARPGARELFPGIRVDLAAHTVEFDGTVPIDAHDPRAPRVYLEVTVCTPDTKEHEALVVTRARPSDVHAALLAAGVTPGSPGAWKWENQKLIATPPAGDAVDVVFITTAPDGTRREANATDWIVNAETGAPFAPPGSPGFVFAGSILRERQGKEVYDADGTGTLIGLCTFGAETIAWKRLISPDSETEEPVWIADPRRVPPAGTPVTVRIAPRTP